MSILKKVFHCSFSLFINFFTRKEWSLDEDIFVLSECRENQWKWGNVAKTLVNRNQHQIKNRFIYLMSKGLECTKENLHEMIRKKCLDAAVLSVLEGLRSDFSINLHHDEDDDNQAKENDSSSEIWREDQSHERFLGLKKVSFYFSLEFL